MGGAEVTLEESDVSGEVGGVHKDCLGSTNTSGKQQEF